VLTGGGAAMLHERIRCWLRDATTSQTREAQQEAEPVDGRLWDNQPNKSDPKRGGGTTRLLRGRGASRLQVAAQQEA
jgi:hypothetical protein